MITSNDNIKLMITPNENINDNTLKNDTTPKKITPNASKMITYTVWYTMKNDNIQALKNDNIYTMKKDNILYTRK